MRRSRLIALAAVTVAACQGGAREMGRTMFARSGVATGEVVRGTARSDADGEAPVLRSIARRGAESANAAATADADPGRAPAPGGVVVRAAGGPARTAAEPASPPPPAAFMKNADPRAALAAPPGDARPRVGPSFHLDEGVARRRGSLQRRSRDLLVREAQLTATLAASMPAPARAAPPPPSAVAPTGAAPHAQEFHFSDELLSGPLARPDGEYLRAARPATSTSAPAPAAPPAARPPGANVTAAVAAPRVVTQQLAPSALTAATVGDHDRRDNYLEYLARHGELAERLGLDMTRRVRFHVVDARGTPVNDARITLSAGWLHRTGRTHADGHWDFFPSADVRNVTGALAAEIHVGQIAVRTTVALPTRGDAPAPVVIRLPATVAAPPPVLDLGFLIDVTGSMGDELSYVTREVAGIVQRVEAAAPGARVRVGATLYRDRGDHDPLQQIAFTRDVPGFAAAMQQARASGGGDYPEDLNAAIESALTSMAWSEGPAVRVLVLIADAPPQMYPDEHFTWRDAMSEASRRGIRLLPVAASGADDTVEYLFRAMATYTSTPYVYLTDDSGIGAPHREADTDRVGVERFADLLTRLVTSDLQGRGMHEAGALGPQG